MDQTQGSQCRVFLTLVKTLWKLELESNLVFFFFSGDKTEGNLYKGFFGGKCGPKSPDLGIFLLFFPLWLACNKIWLSPLVDDGQTAYLTKLVKNMIKKKKRGGLAERKGKEKKIIMLYLVTTKLNT